MNIADIQAQQAALQNDLRRLVLDGGDTRQVRQTIAEVEEQLRRSVAAAADCENAGRDRSTRLRAKAAGRHFDRTEREIAQALARYNIQEH